eukprot:529358-Amphidinium_carterae.1
MTKQILINLGSLHHRPEMMNHETAYTEAKESRGPLGDGARGFAIHLTGVIEPLDPWPPRGVERRWRGVLEGLDGATSYRVKACLEPVSYTHLTLPTILLV